MKTCPTCHREYDDAVRFCLEDGATLERTGESAHPTMTMPAQPAFQTPPPPTLTMPARPSMSVGRTLLNVFVAPSRAFASFRDVATFGPAAIRFLIAAAIILVAVVAYTVLYFARIGQVNITRAAIEASPRMSQVPEEQKERVIHMQQNPTFRAVTLAMAFVRVIGLLLISMPLGALIYWLGAMAFKAPLKYMQALLVWTYSGLPPTVLWMIANVLTLIIWPPTEPIRILTGGNGVFPGNVGAFFTGTTFPIPVYAVALSALDIFGFYGIILAVVGLRKAGRVSWPGALVIVIVVWLVGVFWRIGTAGVVSALTS